MEKMTKPANMLVKELMQQTMTESLYGRDKAQRRAIVTPISLPYQPVTHCRELGGGCVTAILHLAAECIYINPGSLKMAASDSCFPNIWKTLAVVSPRAALWAFAEPLRSWKCAWHPAALFRRWAQWLDGFSATFELMGGTQFEWRTLSF